MRGGVISSLSSSSSSVDFVGSFFMPLDGCVFFLVDHTPCEDLTMCPFIVSTAHGQYFAALEYVIPGHVARFPLLIALSHADFTGNPAAACMYCTSASTLGRSYTLCAAGVVCLIYL